MDTFLFDRIIIGPIHSRRLGSSLGVNLLLPNSKLCNFNCIYCECGWNGAHGTGGFNPAERVVAALEHRLAEMAEAQELPDVITFAGNGEPTMHPDFGRIIDATLRLRDRYAPQTRVAVLSNATMIDRPAVREALLRVDRNILKLDSAVDETVRRINQPQNGRTVAETIDLLGGFEGRLVVQTMLLRGDYGGHRIDNTTQEEVEAYIGALGRIRPAEVMLYTIDRNTPADGLEKVSFEEMEAIATRLREAFPGLVVSVAR
ncbi:radical SAM protein [uncultured Rikenella sp.]|uniref:radical SAM protein n=1 Tax=uncultured Rikenella sp. TaxID=368003 RepID=UPI0025E51DB1|nr:radical SAM protein [uncultured Rikenella sp.]